MDHVKLAILVILASAIVYVNGCGRSHYRGCRNHHGNRKMYPYYFGTTNLNCLNKSHKKGRRKRDAAPSIHVHRLSHRFIYYRGHYIEYFGTERSYSDSTSVNTYPQPRDRDCDSTIDDLAGYGVLSVYCIKLCARMFVREFEYSTLGNNCHHFVNLISYILCHYNTCPSGCLSAK